MKKQRIHISFKSYDAKQLDKNIQNIITVVKGKGSKVVGPIPLPTKKKVFCVNRSPHVDKKSREQFQYCVYKRLLYIENVTKETMDSLMEVKTFSCVDIKMDEGI
jgi:small subunit ribosomal protein S10